jgi:alpha-glucosidase
LTNWDARTLTLKLDFVEHGQYHAAIFRDGVNAHRVASDYVFKDTTATKDAVITVNMKPGGGWAAVLTPAD